MPFNFTVNLKRARFRPKYRGLLTFCVIEQVVYRKTIIVDAATNKKMVSNSKMHVIESVVIESVVIERIYCIPQKREKEESNENAIMECITRYECSLLFFLKRQDLLLLLYRA